MPTLRQSDQTQRANSTKSAQLRLALRSAPGENGCIVWIGARHEDGYGVLNVGGRRVYAHRFAWELKHGAIPAELVIDHLCRNPPCVNTAHMELVTIGENVRRSPIAGRTRIPPTHCKHGHEFTDANTYRDKDGHRGCRACKRDYMRRKRAAARLVHNDGGWREWSCQP